MKKKKKKKIICINEVTMFNFPGVKRTRRLNIATWWQTANSVKWPVSFTKFQALLVDERAPSELEKVGFNLSEILFYCKKAHSARNNFSAAGRQAGSPVTLNRINCLFEELHSQNSAKFGISLTVPPESSTDF